MAEILAVVVSGMFLAIQVAKNESDTEDLIDSRDASASPPRLSISSSRIVGGIGGKRGCDLAT
jgi:hypothetical protein